MYMYAYARECNDFARRGAYTVYRWIDWRRLGERSEVMVGNGVSECQELRCDRLSRARETGSLRTRFTPAI